MLAPGAPHANRKWLFGVKVGRPKHQDRAGLTNPAGNKISSAFAAVGLIYMSSKHGELKSTSLGPLDIRHTQAVAKYEEYKRKEPGLTENQLSEKIAVYFNHGINVSRGYLRKIFDDL
jgi:hypothetical protein